MMQFGRSYRNVQINSLPTGSMFGNVKIAKILDMAMQVLENSPERIVTVVIIKFGDLVGRLNWLQSGEMRLIELTNAGSSADDLFSDHISKFVNCDWEVMQHDPKNNTDISDTIINSMETAEDENKTMRLDLINMLCFANMLYT